MIIRCFKIDINSHIKSAWLLILGFLFCINASRILSLLYPNESHKDSSWMGIVLFIVFVVPGLIIHINYYLVNRGNIFEYSIQEGLIRITRMGNTTTFSLADIHLIERSMSFNFAASRSSVALWDGYNHSVIYLKSGEVFTVTSLLVPSLDLPIENAKVKIKTNFYRLAKLR